MTGRTFMGPQWYPSPESDKWGPKPERRKRRRRRTDPPPVGRRGGDPEDLDRLGGLLIIGLRDAARAWDNPGCIEDSAVNRSRLLELSLRDFCDGVAIAGGAALLELADFLEAARYD